MNVLGENKAQNLPRIWARFVAVQGNQLLKRVEERLVSVHFERPSFEEVCVV